MKSLPSCMPGKHPTTEVHPNPHLFFILRQSLSKFSRLALNSFCSPSWPWACSPPITAYWVPGMTACPTRPSFFTLFCLDTVCWRVKPMLTTYLPPLVNLLRKPLSQAHGHFTDLRVSCYVHFNHKEWLTITGLFTAGSRKGLNSAGSPPVTNGNKIGSSVSYRALV